MILMMVSGAYGWEIGTIIHSSKRGDEEIKDIVTAVVSVPEVFKRILL